MSILNTSKFDHTEKKAFFDGELGMQRYDTVKYRAFDKLTDKQLGFFWRPEEVDVLRDAKDFKELNEHEQHIFTSNLKRQILLDSVQGRAPAEAFNPITSLPELENWITTWTFSETIHSRSYTHIIRNIYSNPSKIFDEVSLGINAINVEFRIPDSFNSFLKLFQSSLSTCGISSSISCFLVSEGTKPLLYLVSLTIGQGALSLASSILALIK